jgi:hypothetical protein
MSVRFVARYSITYVEDVGGGEFEVTGDIYDDSLQGYTAADAEVGDAIVDDNNLYGTNGRWLVTQIVDVTGSQLVCRVAWDDLGSPPDENGPSPGDAAISRTTPFEVAEIPTLAYTKVSEPLQMRLQSIDAARNLVRPHLSWWNIKDDNYTIPVIGINKTFIMNSSDDKVFNLPELTSAYVGAFIQVGKIGTGRLTINAPTGVQIEDSAAGGTIYCTEPEMANLVLELISATKWKIVYYTNTWITTG